MLSDPADLLDVPLCASPGSSATGRDVSSTPTYVCVASPPALDLSTLKRYQARLDGICPDGFGLRWFAERDRVCLYGARDVDVPYDHFIRSVNIVDVHRRVLRGAHRVIGRFDRSADEHRIWTHTRLTDDVTKVAEQGYFAIRRRPDGGVRVAMLTSRCLPSAAARPLIGHHRWRWLRAQVNARGFRCIFRRTIGTVESLYAGPPLRVSH
ncbi:MAG: hypothetical protein WBG36_04065 [Ornithinimicrobium sp.]